VKEHVNLDPELINNSRNLTVKNKLMKMFPQRLTLLLEEFYCMILTPYILWFILKTESCVICDHLINILTINHSINGLVDSNSLFINCNQIKNNPKTEKSFEYFQKTYPESAFLFYVFNQETYYPSQSIHETENINSAEQSIEIKPTDLLLNY
jgi:hypothetical protein